MITLKSPREIEMMRKSGAILAGVHLGLRDIIKPGISSWDIERFANKYIEEHGAKAEEKGFEGTSMPPVSVSTMKLPTPFPARNCC